MRRSDLRFAPEIALALDRLLGADKVRPGRAAEDEALRRWGKMTPGNVVLAATRDEAAGAALPIAGLTVIGRALKQLGQSPEKRVVVARDGAIALPTPLPANVEVRTVADGAAAAEIARSLGAPLVGADVVRLDRTRFEGGLRVVDEPTRRAAEDAVFAALYRADLGFVARRLNKPISVRLTRHVLARSLITPNRSPSSPPRSGSSVVRG